MKFNKIEKQFIIDSIKSSISFREICSKLNISFGGSSVKNIKQFIKENNLSSSHLVGKHHNKNKGRKNTKTESYLSGEQKITPHKLRIRLLKDGIFKSECSCCKNTEWLGNKIPLELHHKDGNKQNNSIENLLLLCPNCHYFTENYKSKNRKTSKGGEIGETHQT